MQKAGSLIGALAGLLSPASGECETHGPSEVLARKGVWHCPECFEVQRAAEELVRQQESRRCELLRMARIPVKFSGQAFRAVSDEQKQARLLARGFIDSAVTERRWGALILVGVTGNGKTLLACELAGKLITGPLQRSVRYTTAKEMIGEIQASYGRDDRTEEGEIARFVRPDVLIIDEIDAAPQSANAAGLLNEIIDRRYRQEKPIVAITNRAFDTLAEFVGDRVYSRLHENAYIAAFTGPDQRRAA